MNDKTDEIRNPQVEGVDKLLWPKTDVGGWHGPLADWNAGKKSFMLHVKDFSLVIQAGGCCGMYPRFYSNYFDEIWSFEPSSINFRYLEENCRGSKFHLHHVALGSEQKMVSFLKGREANVGEGRVVEYDGSDPVRMMVIDDLEPKSCGLIHLDLEGYEENALHGSLETITKFKPVIITECHGGEDFLLKLGYELIYDFYMNCVYLPK